MFIILPSLLKLFNENLNDIIKNNQQYQVNIIKKDTTTYLKI